MSEDDFFRRQTASSRVKSLIVSRYFPQYCNIISKKHQGSIRYIDLFAGQGVYDDGQPSTPIILAQLCYKDTNLRNRVQLIFNDYKYKNALEQNFLAHFPNGSFHYKPVFRDVEVGKDDKLRDFLTKSTHHGKLNRSPSVLFIDPFGYKNIETEVLGKFMQNWGNELFIFINSKRIHPALLNDKFDDLMKTLFPTTLESVRGKRRFTSNTNDRLNLIIDSIGDEYKAMLNTDQVYYAAFQFQEEDSEATSHYILHICKHHRGFDLVKQIFTEYDNIGAEFDGRHTYTFDVKRIKSDKGMFDLADGNLQRLADRLLSRYSGQSMNALELFDKDHQDGLWSRAHYRDALRKLVEEKRVTSTFGDGKTHHVTASIDKDCHLTFN